MSSEMKNAVDFLYSMPRFTKKNSLEHTRQLMRLLGSPCLSRKVIHIAGSNGKGSVSCFLYNMLLAGGKSAALFTSPHLVDIRERFQMNGELVGEEEFLSVYKRVREASNALVQKTGRHPTFFEFLFAMGMVIFEQADVEYIVLETGLGGRLDATNSFPTPVLTVITSISLEHTEYLGNTLAKIAGEKAGILKPGVPVVFSANEPEAEAVIRARAKEQHCSCVAVFPYDKSDSSVKMDDVFEPVRFAIERWMQKRNQDELESAGFLQSGGKNGREDGLLQPGGKNGREGELVQSGRKMFEICEIKKNVIDFFLWNEYHEKTKWSIPFSAPYQAENAAVAITAMQMLNRVDTDAIQQGLMNTRWPGRMQQIRPDIYLDGAHNPSGISVFVDSVRALTKDDELPPLLLFSMVRDKDVRTSVTLLADGISWDAIAVTAIPDERGTPSAELARIFATETGRVVETYDDYREAWQTMIRRKRDGQKLFCTGSLYFIGALLLLVN